MATRVEEVVGEEVLDEAIAHMIERHREVRALDETRLRETGGIYCVVEGCSARRTGGYRVCSNHRHGRRGKPLYSEGAWHAWENQKRKD